MFRNALQSQPWTAAVHLKSPPPSRCVVVKTVEKECKLTANALTKEGQVEAENKHRNSTSVLNHPKRNAFPKAASLKAYKQLFSQSHKKHGQKESMQPSTVAADIEESLGWECTWPPATSAQEELCRVTFRRL